MEKSEVWRWIWLVASGALVLGELATTSFFLLPLAVGAFVAAILSFAGAPVAVGWAAFVLVSAAGIPVLQRMAKRLDENIPTLGTGARRLIGEPALVTEQITGGGGDFGRVTVQGELWLAEALDGEAVAEGAQVKVVEVKGNRLVVWPES